VRAISGLCPVPSDELVDGDLGLLDAGDKVPADVRLTRQSELRVIQSALTRESVPVAKDEIVLPETIPVADRRNMAYSGLWSPQAAVPRSWSPPAWKPSWARSTG
jgi:magnesium-transporting ATPase (P-type)